MSRKHSFVSSGKQAKGAKPPLFRGRSNSQSSATEVRVLGKAKAPGDHHNTSSAALPRLVGAERNGAGTGGPSSSSSTPELSKGSRVNGAEQIVADQKKELARLRSEFEAISKVVLKLQDDSKKTATDFAERERLWKAEQSARDDLVASLEKENRDLLAKVKGADAKNQLAMEKVEMLRKELEIMKREKEEITMEAERDAAAVAAASAAAIVAATEETTNFCSAATQTDSDVPDSTKVADDEGRQKQQMAEMEILIAKQYEEMERTVQAEQAVSSGLRGKLLEAEERLKTFSEEVVSLRQVAKEITNLEHNMNKLKKKYEMAQKQVQAARAIPARIRKQLMEEQKRSGEAARKVRDAMAKVQDELAATRADMETQTAEVEVLKRHVDELQSKLRSLTGGGDDGGGGSLSSDLADTYDEVMGEELRVMRESYEAKIEALKLQMTKEQRNASKAARTAAKEHSEVEAMLKMRVLSLEAERAALLGET